MRHARRSFTRSRARPAALALLILTALLWAGCNRQPGQPAGRKPLIVATVFPVADLASQLVGDWAQVTLLPADESRELTDQPDLLIAVGTEADRPLEARVRAGSRAELKVLRFVELASQPLRQGSAAVGATQPVDRASAFPWLDLAQTDRFLMQLGVALEPMFPGRGPSLRNRVRLLRTNLLLLHQEFEAKFGQLPHKNLAVIGGGLDPLTQRYGLQIVARLEDGPPADLIEQLKRSRLPVVYSCAVNPLPESVRQAVRGQVEVLRIEPMGDPERPGYSSYLEMMRSNLQMILKGQGRVAGRGEG